MPTRREITRAKRGLPFVLRPNRGVGRVSIVRIRSRIWWGWKWRCYSMKYLVRRMKLPCAMERAWTPNVLGAHVNGDNGCNMVLWYECCALMNHGAFSQEYHLAHVCVYGSMCWQIRHEIRREGCQQSENSPNKYVNWGWNSTCSHVEASIGVPTLYSAD